MFHSLLVLSALSPFVAAFVYPDVVPLEKRQAPGTPQYECHADCGGVITIARTPEYCESSNFTSSLEACLECAEEYDIWRYYGESVSAAAESCGLEATPVAANGTASDTDTTTMTESGTATTSATSTITEDASSSATEEATSSAAAEGTDSASEQSASATSEETAAATSSEGGGAIVKPAMVIIGLGLGAALL